MNKEIKERDMFFRSLGEMQSLIDQIERAYIAKQHEETVHAARTLRSVSNRILKHIYKVRRQSIRWFPPEGNNA
jgi:hypothetical protein